MATPIRSDSDVKSMRSGGSCPGCSATDVNPRQTGFCTRCGYVDRKWFQLRLQLLQAGLGAGLVLLAAAAATALLGGMVWLGALLLLPGLAVVALVLFLLHKASGSMLDALSRRQSGEMNRFQARLEQLYYAAIGFFALALVAGWAFYLSVQRPRNIILAETRRFQSALEGFTRLVPELGQPIDPKTVGSPRLIGKTVLIDVEHTPAPDDQGKPTPQPPVVSPLQLQLPAAIRARSSEEVGTVVLLNWVPIRFGWYDPDTKRLAAYRVDCQVLVIDVAKKALIDRQDFQGGNPPQQHAGTGPTFGPRANSQVLAYLLKLPRE